MGRLTGKVALITGAGQGVGLGIARAFAREGANLVITGRDEAKLKAVAPDLEALGARVVIRAGDAGVRANAEAAVQAAIEAFGRLDVLVNNAQSLKPGVMLEDMSEADIRATMDSGFYASLWHSLAALPHMKAAGGGSIINLGSREGMMGGAGMAIYGANKEAMRGLGRSLAREWGQYNIRINVIAPAAWGPAAEAYFNEHPEYKQIYLKDICLGRFGDPEGDIGPAAVFLASEDSHYVTGQTLNVDGGQVML
jgi:NAD(P)-dependent dehydrogenase (short-subunit alcohol dehydrogenase family)